MKIEKKSFDYFRKQSIDVKSQTFLKGGEETNFIGIEDFIST